jgi:hypothetical protein
VAILSIDGWKATNHDCLFQYLTAKKQELELDFYYLNELRKLRNNIDYQGVKVSATLWNQNKLKVELLIRTLADYVKGKLN